MTWMTLFRAFHESFRELICVSRPCVSLRCAALPFSTSARHRPSFNRHHRDFKFRKFPGNFCEPTNQPFWGSLVKSFVKVRCFFLL